MGWEVVGLRVDSLLLPPPVLRGRVGRGPKLTIVIDVLQHVRMLGRRDHSRRLLSFARQMRKAPTDAEKKLWWLLRRGKLDGYHFRRQVPISGFIVDFCCLSAGLGVEADGGQHYDDRGKEYDQQRTEALMRKGIRIIRFSDYDILKFPDAVQEMIYKELTQKPPPSPSPGVPGEGIELRHLPRVSP
jgi:very-short-patch-repair endonuclease